MTRSGTAALLRDLVQMDIETTVGPQVERATVAEAAAAVCGGAGGSGLAPVGGDGGGHRAQGDRRHVHGGSRPVAAVDALAALAKEVRAQRAARVPAAALVWRSALKEAQRARELAQAANVRKAASVEQQHLVTLMKALQG